MIKVLVLDDRDIHNVIGKLMMQPQTEELASRLAVWADVRNDRMFDVVHVKTVNAAIHALSNVRDGEEFSYVILDNDLGFFDDRDGFRVLDWIEEQVMTTERYRAYLPEIIPNTGNAAARERMRVILDRVLAARQLEEV